MVAQPAVGDDIAVLLGDMLATALSSWQPYTPTFGSSGSGVNLGTGSTQYGEYLDLGSTTLFSATITFGSSGFAAGAGYYVVGLPHPWKGTGPGPLGYAMLAKNNTGAYLKYTGALVNASQMAFRYGDNSNATWGAASPAAPAAGDSMTVWGFFSNA